MLTVLLLLAVVLSLSLGTPYVAPADVLRALSGAGTPYDLVVFDLRLPRVVLAAVAGAAFGVAGTLIQSVARNPLASPDVIGITQGAGLAATVALTSGMAAVLVAPTALVGGLLAAVLLFALGARHGLAAQRFVLAGVAVAFALPGADRGGHAHRRPDRRAARADLADRHPGRQGLDRGRLDRRHACWCCCRCWPGPAGR